MTRAATPRSGDVDMAPSAVVRHLCHEVRQPLSTIESSAYYLQMVLKTDSRTEKELERIQEMVRQVDWILMDFVHYLQAAPPRAEWVDLGEVVSSAVRTAAKQRPLDLQWSDQAGTALILIDPGQAEHLVRTLFSVFRQVSKPDRAIQVRLWREQDQVVLGFRSEVDTKVLECADDLMLPFTPHLPAGLGLALASAQRIAESHKGSASLDVQGQDLLIEVRLPAQ
jgi:signal transduction histidine kinase